MSQFVLLLILLFCFVLSRSVCKEPNKTAPHFFFFVFVICLVVSKLYFEDDDDSINALEHQQKKGKRKGALKHKAGGRRGKRDSTRRNDDEVISKRMIYMLYVYIYLFFFVVYSSFRFCGSPPASSRTMTVPLHGLAVRVSTSASISTEPLRAATTSSSLFWSSGEWTLVMYTWTFALGFCEER